MGRALTFGSLFAGVGGLDLGFERAGMVCKWQVEIDDYATQVLERHWPNVRRWKDIRIFPPDTDGVALASWQVDLICGGFPCQDISYAGRGAGIEGERSGLFGEAMRVVSVLAPRYVVLENVAALLTRGMGIVLGTLASLGYNSEWHCIPAASFGAPHIRDRVFILANAKRVRIQQRGTGDGGSTDVEQLRRSNSNDGRPPMHNRPTFPTSIITTQPQISDFWSVEPRVGRVAHGIPKRMDRLRCLGNAVLPQVAEFIARSIVHYDNHTSQTKAADHTV